jgi:isoleucyl-tRNA synthetase
MSKNYKTYTTLNLSQTAKDVQKKWDEENTFEKSITLREGKRHLYFTKDRQAPMVCQAFTT